MGQPATSRMPSIGGNSRRLRPDPDRVISSWLWSRWRSRLARHGWWQSRSVVQVGRYQEFPQLVVATAIEAMDRDPTVVVHPDCGRRVLLAVIQRTEETPAVLRPVGLDAAQAGQNGVDNQLFRCLGPLCGARICHNRVNLLSRLALIAVRPASRTARLYHCSSTGIQIPNHNWLVALRLMCATAISQHCNAAILRYHPGPLCQLGEPGEVAHHSIASLSYGNIAILCWPGTIAHMLRQKLQGFVDQFRLATPSGGRDLV